MKALITILPVFFMIALGVFSNKKKFISREEVNGLNSVIYKIFLPIMVFNATFSTELKSSILVVVLFVFAIHLIAIIIGQVTSKFVGERFSHISKFLMCSVDGGNVCFPLYATIVGSSYISNILLLDIACMFIVFLVIPLMVGKETNKSSNKKDMIKNILYNPIVISLLIGFILNKIGAYNFVNNGALSEIYSGIISMATAPIIAIILFMIGYNFKIEKSSMKPLLKCIISRVIIMALAILLFVSVFSSMIQDKKLFIAVILYFMCPPALIMQIQLKDLFKNEEDASFISAFTSLYMVISLIVYTLITLFLV